jgi:hypothetical protein
MAIETGVVAGDVTIEAIVDRNAVAAVATYHGKDGALQGVGSSKRNKDEVFNSMVGQRLAISRALFELAGNMAESVLEG